MSSFRDSRRHDPRKLRILSYNVGLLRVKLLGLIEVWGNPPYATARLPMIPEKLLSVDADIIALQGISFTMLYILRYATICQSYLSF